VWAIYDLCDMKLNYLKTVSSIEDFQKCFAKEIAKHGHFILLIRNLDEKDKKGNIFYSGGLTDERKK
jgi:predicted small secreted protein